MALSLEDIDKEIAARQGMGNSSLDEIDAELQKRGVKPEDSMSKVQGIVKSVASAVMPDLATVAEIYADPAKRKIAEDISSMPMRGLRGAATTAIGGLPRGAEAVDPDFKPQGVGEHLADFAASFGDPRNAIGGLAIEEGLGLARNVASPIAKFAGKQAARAVQVATGVPAEDVIATAKKPMEVLLSKLSKNSGKIFQGAKEAAGVTPAEERLIAGIGDPSGFKRVADELAEKFAKGEQLTAGEALAWKKAAGELARKGKGSARFIYSQDATEAEKILSKVAPDVLVKQKDVALSKLRDSFMSVLPRNKGASPAVLRSGAALGLGATGNPLAALAMSPLLAGLPATVATGLATKAVSGTAGAIEKSPVARQTVLALIEQLKKKFGEPESHRK